MPKPISVYASESERAMIEKIRAALLQDIAVKLSLSKVMILCAYHYYEDVIRTDDITEVRK